jgi:8-hydroxy-5-deazaflavin:NADPH oxidoreductase
MVGQAIAGRLIELGHEVKMGSRKARNEKAVAWAEAAGSEASEGSFADAAEFGELVVNATPGNASVEVCDQAGAQNLAGKVLVDISNPLDFSEGMPPKLGVCNDDSVGEQIQRAFPDARVVKALNTVNASVMVSPGNLGSSTHIFVCGNDAAAKGEVTELLRSFGWGEDAIVDLGDISSSRGTEMYLPLWLRLMGALDTPMFNIGIVRAS